MTNSPETREERIKRIQEETAARIKAATEAAQKRIEDAIKKGK